MMLLVSLFRRHPLQTLIIAANMLKSQAATTGSPAPSRTFPPLSGNYPVGSIAMELVEEARQDPLSPTGGPRDLMVSIFYPASNVSGYEKVLDIPPRSAAAFATYYSAGGPNIPANTFTNVYTQAYREAPPLDSSFPFLLFSPGFSASRLLYSGIAEELASHGFVVGVVDHPYDTIFVEYPDGRTVSPNWASTNGTRVTEDSQWIALLNNRLADFEFLYGQLDGLGRKHSLLGSVIDTSKIGFLGHSYGGLTALSAMANNSAVKCGANLDGRLYTGSLPAPVVTKGVGADRSVLLMSTSVHNSLNDDSWVTFLGQSAAGFYSREIGVYGAKHDDYTDAPLILQLDGYFEPPFVTDPLDSSTDIGIIDPQRMLQLLTTYVDDFFSHCLKGTQQKLLGGPMLEYPEIQFISIVNGTQVQ